MGNIKWSNKSDKAKEVAPKPVTFEDLLKRVEVLEAELTKLKGKGVK